MTEWILRGIEAFSVQTGIAGKILLEVEQIEIIFLVLGIALLFAGAKAYRILSSLIVFVGVTVLLCTVMDGKAGWGTIVTAFTIIGCLLGGMAYKWETADAMLISAITAAVLVWNNYPVWWLLLIIVIVAAVIAGFFPLEAVIASTVTAGTILIGECGYTNLILAAAAGLLVQLILFERKSERGQKIWKRYFAKK